MDVCFVLLTRARVPLGVNDARIMMARMHGVWRRGSVHVVRSAAPHARARSSPAEQQLAGPATRHTRARGTPGPAFGLTAPREPTVELLPTVDFADCRLLTFVLLRLAKASTHTHGFY